MNHLLENPKLSASFDISSDRIKQRDEPLNDKFDCILIEDLNKVSNSEVIEKNVLKPGTVNSGLTEKEISCTFDEKNGNVPLDNIKSIEDSESGFINTTSDKVVASTNSGYSTAFKTGSLLEDKNNEQVSVVFQDVGDTMKDVTTSSSENPKEVENSCAANKYRDQAESSDWSDDEDGDSSSSSDCDEFFSTLRKNTLPKIIPLVKTRGELDLDDLPPIEDLIFPVSEEQLEKVGNVHSIVDKQVVIHTLKDTKPLDLDSVLFLCTETTLGRVFDVFGPVSQPFYTVRFNSDEHIKQKGIEIGADVYFVPKNEEITFYVFMDELQNQKGSDASWKDNNEPPEEHLDYSDDEQERAAKKKKQARNRSRFNNNDNADVNIKRPAFENGSAESPFRVPASPVRRRPFRGRGRFQLNPFHSSYVSPPSPASSISSISSMALARPLNPFRSSYISPPSPASSISSISNMAPARPLNPFRSSYISPPSPTCSVSSMSSIAPVRVPHSYRSNTSPSPVSFQPSHMQHYSRPIAPPSPMFCQPPPVFGQMAVIGPVSPALNPLRSPLSFDNVPALIPAVRSPDTYQNPFNQRFSPSPNPSPPAISPWLPGRGPSTIFENVPPNAPLSVQIPPNFGQPSPLHSFQTVPNHQAQFQQAYGNSVNNNSVNNNSLFQPSFYR